MLKSDRRRVSLLLLCTFAIVVTGSVAHATQIIVVEPVLGDFVASGNALRTAVASTSDATSAKRYLVKVEPGVYDLGHDPLYLGEWVDLEGSGVHTTKIVGYGSDDRERGVVNGSKRSEVRNLKIVARTGANVIAFYSNTGGVLADVEAVAINGTQCWAVRFGSGSAWPTVRDSYLYANCSVYNSGLSSKMGMHLTIRDTRIRSFGASDELSNIGLYFDGGAMPYHMADVHIHTGNGDTSGVGIKLANDYAPSNWLDVSGVYINTTAGIGIYTETTASIRIRHSNIVGSRVGVQFSGHSTNSYLQVQNSLVTGSANTLAAPGTTALSWIGVGASQLVGGPISAPGVPAQCAGVYDENYGFYANTCP